jgi:hypothetical protein
MYIFKTLLYIYSIVQKVQLCFTARTNFSISKHDLSKMISINKQYNFFIKDTIKKIPYFEFIAKKNLVEITKSQFKIKFRRNFQFLVS